MLPLQCALLASSLISNVFLGNVSVVEKVLQLGCEKSNLEDIYSIADEELLLKMLIYYKGAVSTFFFTTIVTLFP